MRTVTGLLLFLGGCGASSGFAGGDGTSGAVDMPPAADSLQSPTLDMVVATFEPLPTGFPELPAPPVASGNALEVGATRTYKKPCDALVVAKDGDTIDIAPGSYPGDTCHVTANNLTIRGIAARPVIDIAGVKPWGCKAIWVLGGHDILIENVEFAGAHLRPSDPFVVQGSCPADKNGAGLRLEGQNLTLRYCLFHDNDDGILGGVAGSAVLIEHTEFHDNSFDGYSHNLYINRIAQLTFRYNWTHHTNADGHLLKSRAMKNIILYNRITGETGPDSYEINLPNGGESYVIGNVIQQGAATSNSAILDYASEGIPMGYDNHLWVVNNTFVNDRNGGTFIQLANAPVAVAVNNIFSGLGAITNSPVNLTAMNDLADTQGSAKFAGPANYDYHLMAGSAAAGVGADPGGANGYMLAPVNEYVHPIGARARLLKAKLDLGAFAGP